MYKLKEEITNLQNREISGDVFVRSNKVYVKNFMYDGSWNIRVGNKYVNLQGGIPGEIFDKNLDPDILEEIEES